MRRMVVSCHVTVANYEYLVYWRFYQDGNIECEVRATGIMVTTPYAEGASAPRTGTVVDNRTYAPFHQHFIVARLDLDVDGGENTVMEVDSEALPVSDDNPYGLDLVTNATPVRSEAEAGRDYRWETQRSWKVVNPTRTNRHGTNTAYKLVPTACFPSMLEPATAAVPQGAGYRSHALGHSPPRRRALACRCAPDPVRRRRGDDPLDRRRRAVGEHRRGALVRLRPPPHHPPGGLADHACRHDLLLAQAVRVLRPEPVDRRTPVRLRRKATTATRAWTTSTATPTTTEGGGLDRSDGQSDSTTRPDTSPAHAEDLVELVDEEVGAVLGDAQRGLDLEHIRVVAGGVVDDAELAQPFADG